MIYEIRSQEIDKINGDVISDDLIFSSSNIQVINMVLGSLLKFKELLVDSNNEKIYIKNL